MIPYRLGLYTGTLIVGREAQPTDLRDRYWCIGGCGKCHAFVFSWWYLHIVTKIVFCHAAEFLAECSRAQLQFSKRGVSVSIHGLSLSLRTQCHHQLVRSRSSFRGRISIGSYGGTVYRNGLWGNIRDNVIGALEGKSNPRLDDHGDINRKRPRLSLMPMVEVTLW